MKSAFESVPAIDLPVGGRLLGFANLKLQSAECSAVTNLQTQLAPAIVFVSSLSRVLELLRPPIVVIRELPNPSEQGIIQFAKAAEDLMPCLSAFTPTGILPFVRDTLYGDSELELLLTQFAGCHRTPV